MRFSLNDIKKTTLFKGSLFAIFSFFNRGVGFVLLIILANYIAPSEYGQLSLFNTVVMLVGYFIAMSTEGYVDISYFKQSNDKFKSDLTVIISVATVIFVLILSVILCIGDYLGEKLELTKELLFLAVVISFCQAIYNILLSFRRVREEVVKYGVISCGYAILNFVITLILVITYHQGWMGRVYAQLSCMVAFSLIACITFVRFRLINFSFSQKDLKRILFWGIPLIPHLATTWLRQGCDRYIINYHYELAEVGLFSFALNLANIIEMVGASFNSTNSVSIFKTLSDDTRTNEQKIQSLSKQSREMLIIYVIAALIIVFGGIVLVPIVMPKYAAAIPMFIILSVYGLLRCVYYIYCNFLFYWNLNKFLMYITFGSAIIHLGLSLIFTKYSLLITTTIYVITQILIDIIVISVARNKINAELPIVE